MADVTYSTLSTATTVGTGNATDGTGNFDELMQVVTLHLEDQFTAGRITGTDYANVYLGALQSTLDQAVSFTLSMNKANEEATLLEKQQTMVDNQAATELKQALDIQAATALKGAQEDLVDKQVLTETAKELQTDAQISLVNQQEITEFAQTEQATAGQAPVAGSLLALQALKVEQDIALVADQEALVAQQKLTEEKNTTLVDKRRADVEKDSELKGAQKLLVDQQKSTEVEKTDLVDKQATTETAKATDLGSATTVRNALKDADVTLKGKQGDKLAAEEKLVDAQELKVDADKLLVDATKLKVDEEKGLLTQKKYTEYAQTGLSANGTATTASVLGKQSLLFVEQAKGFKWNADAKYLKTIVDAYSVNRSIVKGTDTATLPAVGGIATSGVISNTSQVGDYMIALKPTDT